MINKIRNHYKKTFVKHGPSSLGVDWKNEDQSLARHNTFYNLLHNVNNKKSIELLDVGCGYGAFYDFIKKRTEFNIKYNGIDVVYEMVNFAKKHHENNVFSVKNILNIENDEKYDVVVANGLFTQKLSFSNHEMTEFFIDCIRKVDSLSKKAFIFNLLSEKVNFKNPGNFYLTKEELVNYLSFLKYSKVLEIENSDLHETTFMYLK